MDLPTLGTSPKQSLSESATREAKDLAPLQGTWRTVRRGGADRPQGLGGLSASLKRTVRK
jgi:hypothetical protein